MKNKLFNSYILISTLISFSLSSCTLSTNCYQVGYSQQINSSYLDKTKSQVYFIYSYFKESNLKQLALYKVDFKQKYEEIVKIDKIDYNPTSYKNIDTNFYFKEISQDKLFIRLSIRDKNQDLPKSIYYLVDTNKKELIYKKEIKEIYNLNFSNNNENLFYTHNHKKLSKISIFNILQGIDYEIDISNEISFLNNYDSKYRYYKYSWVNFNTIVLTLEADSSIKKVIIYNLKDNKISKSNEFIYKEDSLPKFQTDEYKHTNDFKPIMYENNILSYSSYIDKKSNELINNKNYYYNSGLSNVYQIDFTKNEIRLLAELQKTIINSSENTDTESPYDKFVVGKELFYIQDGKTINLLDYKNKLPKGHYNNNIVCGNYIIEDINTDLYPRE